MKAQEYVDKTYDAEQNPSLKKTTVVNVAQFEDEFEVISASLKQNGANYILTVYIADSVGEHTNPTKKDFPTAKFPAASESRINMELTELQFLSQIDEFTEVDSYNNRSVTTCKLEFNNGCVTSQQNNNQRVQTVYRPDARIDKAVYFYCINAPTSENRSMDTIAANFKEIVKPKNILWSFKFTKDQQNINTNDLVLYSNENLHTKLNQVIDKNEIASLCICSENSLLYSVKTKKHDLSQETQVKVNPLPKLQRKRLIAL